MGDNSDGFLVDSIQVADFPYVSLHSYFKGCDERNQVFGAISPFVR